MNKQIFLLCILLPILGFSQSKNKSFFGAQIGIFEARVYNEFDLSSNFSFKTSAGLQGGIDMSDFFVSTLIEVSPKWNYNINKRLAANKNTKYNSSNYLALSVSYTPDWASLTDYKYREIEKLSVIPTYGLKRNFNGRMNYELFFGLGYERYLNTKAINADKSQVGVRFGALIGLDF